MTQYLVKLRTRRNLGSHRSVRELKFKLYCSMGQNFVKHGQNALDKSFLAVGQDNCASGYDSIGVVNSKSV
jgi:hypothetical protein